MAVDGVSATIAKLNRIGANGARMAKASVAAVGDLMVADAKKNAPADLGTIRQNIGKTLVVDGQKVTCSIYSAAPESAFQEFGTGGRVSVPAEMSDVASQFKGQKGGNMAAFILALVGWIKRKGITNTYSVATKKVSKRGTDEQNTQLAYAIAKKILRNGLKPQPFLYPAYVANKDKLLSMLKEAFSQIMRSPQSYF